MLERLKWHPEMRDINIQDGVSSRLNFKVVLGELTSELENRREHREIRLESERIFKELEHKF
ncbi:MAG: hypothetical protein WCT01_03330 [Candidatus Shapirobacteria bacterium]|jgi:hypothetical protein